MQPRAWNVEGLLRPNIPYTAEGSAVQPDRAFCESAGVQECVCRRIDVEGGAVEAGAGARYANEGEFRRFGHGERVDVPSEERFACEAHLFGDAFAFAGEADAEIDTAAVFNEDI